MINGWDIDFLYRAFLIFLRLGALLFFIPIFEGKGVPVMFRAGFALLFTGIIAMSVPDRPVLPAHVLGLVLAGFNELLLGLFMGLVVRVAFQTVSMAGEMISIEGGFMRDASFDPASQMSGPVAQKMLFQFAIVVFLVTGMHLEVFSSFLKSFEVAHLGVWLPSPGAVTGLIAQTAQIFTVSVQMAAPFIAMNFVINATFAVLGKAVPQMNVFMTSFAVMIAAGLLIMVFTLDVVAQYVVSLLKDSAFNLLHLLQAH